MIDIGVTVNYMLFLKIIFALYIWETIRKFIIGIFKIEIPEQTHYGGVEIFHGIIRSIVIIIAILY